MKTVNGCNVYNVFVRLTVKTDKFTLFVYCNFLVSLSTTVCSQNINKQIVNIADENLTDYSFLSRYHYTKSKNYLKRRYRIRHWIPMFIGTPCIYRIAVRQRLMYKYVHGLILIVATTLLIFTFKFEHLWPIPYSITTPPPLLLLNPSHNIPTHKRLF